MRKQSARAIPPAPSLVLCFSQNDMWALSQSPEEYKPSSSLKREISPRSFHLEKILLHGVSASLGASSGFSAPPAAFANIRFSSHVLKISSMAALACPG